MEIGHWQSAEAKVSLPFMEAFFKGVLCNILVCLAVWLAMAARHVSGKILAIIFPVSAFVAAGFEHCAIGDVDSLGAERVQPFLHRVAAAGQKARRHFISGCAEPQVQAGRLDLIWVERRLRLDAARLRDRVNALRRPDAGAAVRFRGDACEFGLLHDPGPEKLRCASAQ